MKKFTFLVVLFLITALGVQAQVKPVKTTEKKPLKNGQEIIQMYKNQRDFSNGMNGSQIPGTKGGKKPSKAALEVIPDYSGFDLSKAYLPGADFTGCKFIGNNCYGATLTGVRFMNANVAGTDFTMADLTGANFKDADVTGANFTGAKVSAGVLKLAKGVYEGAPDVVD